MSVRNTSNPSEPDARGRLLERAVHDWREALSGKVAVVTGGARGIGQVMGQWLIRAGANVVALDRSWAGADEFKSEIEAAQGLALQADITNDADLDAAHNTVLQRYGTVDILINNAALVSETLFRPMGHRLTLDTTDDDWTAMFGVNLFGTVRVTRRFIEPMRQAGRGSIINVVSSGVLAHSTGGAYFSARPYTAEMPYQAAKAAVTTFAFYLAEEVRADGVAVNSFMPGHTRASWFDETAHAYGQAGQVYFQRPVVSEHVVPIALFLSAQDGTTVTGRLYNVPEWNYDYGFGDYAFWQDHNLPAEVEKMYTGLEAATPPFGRSGVPQLPFDAQVGLFVAAMGNMANTEAN